MTARRSFLLTCGGLVAAPVLARVVAPPAACQAAHSAQANVVAGAQDVVLRIAGWDCAAGTGNDAWVQINSSWRANWR